MGKKKRKVTDIKSRNGGKIQLVIDMNEEETQKASQNLPGDWMTTVQQGMFPATLLPGSFLSFV